MPRNNCLHVVLERLDRRLCLAAADVDLGYGSNGRALLDHLGESNDTLRALVVTSDNKLLLAGASSTNSVSKPTLARFNTDGTPDLTFGIGGKLRLASGSAIVDVLANPDGTITTLSASTTGAPLMRRFTASGALDPTFATAVAPVGTATDFDRLGVNSPIYAVVGNNVVRVNPNGAADATFDGDGVLPVAVESGSQQFRPQQILALSDGGFIVGGQFGTTSPNVRTAIFRRYSAAGVRDMTFGNGGSLTLSMLSTVTSVDKLMQQPDGSIVAIVTDNYLSTPNAEGYVARFNVIGTLDNTFDSDGLATIEFSSTQGERIGDIVPDGTGGYLGVGITLNTISATADLRSVLFRMKADGSPDESFGTGGYTGSYTSPTEVNYGAARLALHGDGWLYHATSTDEVYVPPLQDQILMRFNPASGATDSGFGGSSDGKVHTTFTGSTAIRMGQSAPTPDGGVAFVGWVSVDNFNIGMVVGKLDADGRPVLAFGGRGNGTVEINFGNYGAQPFDMKVDPATGKIILAGFTGDSPSASGDYAVVRLNPDGSLDNTFDADGRVTTSFPDSTGAEWFTKVAVDATGRIYGAGPRTGTGTNTAVVRYTSSGQVDATFGSGGRVLLNVAGGMANSVSDLLPLPDGTVLLAGSNSTSTAVGDGYIVHLLEDGSTDASFGSGGAVVFDINGLDTSVRKITRDAAGNIYSLSFLTGTTATVQLRKFTPSGQPDGTFGIGGVATHNAGTALQNISMVVDIDLTPGGKLLVYGRTGGSSTDALVLAFNAADGSLLTSFGTGGKAVHNLSHGSFSDTASDLHVLPSGHFLLTGIGNGPGEQTNDFAALRLAGEDAVAPVVAASSFEYEVAQKVHVDFSEHVNAPAAATLELTNLTTGAVIPVQAGWLSYSPATKRLSIAPSTALADGRYRLTIPAGAATDAAGNALASPVTVNFFVYAGDANRDATVNFADLVILAQNYNQSGRTFSQGDFNYDGTVNFADLVILAQRYGSSLPVVASASTAAPSGAGGKASPKRRSAAADVV